MPVDAAEDTATVKVDVAEPPEGGVWGLGVKDVDTPGIDDAERVTGELKPLTEVIVTLAVPEEALGMVNMGGEADR